MRVLLVEDQVLVRRALRASLERMPDVEVVGEAGDGLEAVRLAAELEPDLVLMDIELPQLNGIGATTKILKQNPDAKILALSCNTDRNVISEILDAGAAGFVDKGCELEELELSLRAVARGEPYYSDSASDVVRKNFLKGDNEHYSPLSARETEVLQLVAEGYSSKEIAHKLKISGRTADAHRRNLMLKLGIRSIAELTLYAVRNGIVFPSASR